MPAASDGCLSGRTLPELHQVQVSHRAGVQVNEAQTQLGTTGLITSKLSQLHTPRPVAGLSQAHTLGRSLAATSSLYLPSSPIASARQAAYVLGTELPACVQGAMLIEACTCVMCTSPTGPCIAALCAHVACLTEVSNCCRVSSPSAGSMPGHTGKSKSLQRILSRTRLAADSSMRSPHAIDAVA